MRRMYGWLPALVAGVLLASACDGSGSAATTSTTAGGGGTTADCPTDGEEWEVAKLYIEHNATDEDTGVHGLFGGEAWSTMCIWDPAGHEILAVAPLGSLHDLAVSDLFFESREPKSSEVSVAEILEAFPEGEYRVGGIDFEGTARSGSALFTHTIPAEPTITFPQLADDPETADAAKVPNSGLVVRWNHVTTTIDGEPIVVTAYEVIITQEEHQDPNGLSQPVFDVHVPPDVTSLSVPDEFLRSGTVYELEVLVLEESGNQTIGLGFFTTE